MWKKALLAGSILAMFVTGTAKAESGGYYNQYTLEPPSDGEYITESIDMHIKFPDNPQRPSNGAEAYNLVMHGTSAHSNGYGHTGWGGVAYACNETPIWAPTMNPIRDKWGNTGYLGGWDNSPGTGYWEFAGEFVTDDSSRSYPPSDGRISSLISSKYGQELYNFAVQSGKDFTVDESIGRPMLVEYDFVRDAYERLSASGVYNSHYGGSVFYSKYDRDTGEQWGSRCTTGDKAGLYRDFDFFVRLKFNLYFNIDGDPGKKGSSEGKTYWELERSGGDADSHVKVYSEYEVPYEKHRAVRNVKHTVNAGSKSVSNDSELIEFTVDTKSTKNNNLNYEFSYEYTNKEIGWQCSGNGDSHSCTYNSNPDWRAVRTHKINGSIAMDHKHGETIKGSNLDEILSNEFVVGRMDEWDENNEVTSSVYHEGWNRKESVPSTFNLKTQTHLPILQGAMSYSVGVPSENHKAGGYMPIKAKGSQGHYLVDDIDESLKASYTNTTDYGYAYEIPIKQHVLADKGMSGDNRQYDWDYTTDLFVISEHAGLITEGAYTSGVSLNSAPSIDSYVADAIATMPVRYLAETNETYVDTELNTTDIDKLQRYYLPVTPDSIYHPNIQYTNLIVYNDMGLNDLKFEFDQKFKFDHYLFGTAKDDAWIVEQVDSRVSFGGGNVNTIQLSQEQIKALANAQRGRTDIRMHDFRIADRDYMEQVKQIVGF